MDDFINSLVEEKVNEIVNKKFEEFERLQEMQRKEKRMAKGMAELSAYLGKSLQTLHRWKKEGTLKGTYLQTGRCIVFDLDKVDAKFSK